MTITDHLDVWAAAMAYGAHGWPVFPLAGKRPLVKGWPTVATCVPDVIASWWRQWPGANVGVVTGPRSGLVVLDVDPRHDGTASLGKLEARVGVLPGTVLGVTGSGGLHMLYAHPGGKVTSRSQAFGVAFPGLDVKGDGGFIVVPPSVHPSTGGIYRWHGGVWAVRLPVWPREQLAVLLPGPEPEPASYVVPQGGGDDRRLTGLVSYVLAAQPGERNVRLFWAACRAHEMVRAGANEAVVRTALLLAAEQLGYPRAEAARSIASAFQPGRVSA